jgi:hypothetical protein
LGLVKKSSLILTRAVKGRGRQSRKPRVVQEQRKGRISESRRGIPGKVQVSRSDSGAVSARHRGRAEGRGDGEDGNMGSLGQGSSCRVRARAAQGQCRDSARAIKVSPEAVQEKTR